MEDFQKLFDSFTTLKVGVIGDVMLDTYIWGKVERISPEAPVPIVSLDKKEYRIGGAGNVALNLVSLGASVTAFSVIGDDDDGALLKKLLDNNNIDTAYLQNSTDRITTSKARIISRNQQMLRLDSETTKDLSASDEKKIIQAVKTYIEKEKPHVIIFEDYNKGVLTEKGIQSIISFCKKNNVFTAVDPKRKNFFSYKEVDIFKPNLVEVKAGLNLLIEKVNIETLKQIHDQLSEKLHHHVSFITLSEKGVFYQYNGQGKIISSHVRHIADVSGAGDTVIAVAALIYAITKDVE